MLENGIVVVIVQIELGYMIFLHGMLWKTDTLFENRLRGLVNIKFKRARYTRKTI